MKHVLLCIVLYLRCLKMKKTSVSAKTEIRKFASPQRRKTNAWFFKTGKGEYGAGDVFIGVSVPDLRRVAKMFSDLTLSEIKKLLQSKIHEERLFALIILTEQFPRSDEKKKKEIYKFYLASTKWVNNWDLVDTSAYKIVGEYLMDKNRAVLVKLANSKNIWERRIAIVSTFQFIRRGQFDDTLNIATILLTDTHDLIHKAVGWMLREVGKKDTVVLEDFLIKHYKTMPRTMLRYAIERLSATKGQAYLRGII